MLTQTAADRAPLPFSCHTQQYGATAAEIYTQTETPDYWWDSTATLELWVGADLIELLVFSNCAL